MEQTIQLFVYGVSIGAVYALIALGFSIIFKTTGLLNFAHQEIMMVGGLFGYTLMTRLDLPLIVTIVAAMIVCSGIAFAMERFGLARIRRRGGSDLNMVVATIGIAIVIMSLAILIWGAYPLSYPHGKETALRLWGIVIDYKYLWILITALAALLVLQLFLRRSRYGLAMRASSADPATAELMGIPTQNMSSLAFAVSGALAGLAGVLIALLYYASFDIGTIGLKALTAAVIGGFGSLPGAVIGGLILGVLETFGTIYLTSDFSNALAFVVLIVVLLVRPSGLIGAKVREI
jgi:branched-subunit amino acid ABC-type transport system permease component